MAITNLKRIWKLYKIILFVYISILKTLNNSWWLVLYVLVQY